MIVRSLVRQKGPFSYPFYSLRSWDVQKDPKGPFGSNSKKAIRWQVQRLPLMEAHPTRATRALLHLAPPVVLRVGP